jgi:hypothetical protein
MLDVTDLKVSVIIWFTIDTIRTDIYGSAVILKIAVIQSH